MRNIFKLVTLCCSFCLTGCDIDNNKSTSNKTIFSLSQYLERNYEDVETKIIYYSNIFSNEKESYYVYFFSRTCSHCSNLKNFIIEKAIERGDIYFVESSDQVGFVDDVTPTIGLDSIEDFGILGYPSLIKIENKIVTKNIAGINPIKKELID